MIKSFRVEGGVSAWRGTSAMVDARNTETQRTEGKAEVFRNEAFDAAVVERYHVNIRRQTHLACALAPICTRPRFMTRRNCSTDFSSGRAQFFSNESASNLLPCADHQGPTANATAPQTRGCYA